MWRKEIKQDCLYKGKRSTLVRQVSSIYSPLVGGERVAWMDHTGFGDCSLAHFTMWAEAEVSAWGDSTS